MTPTPGPLDVLVVGMGCAGSAAARVAADAGLRVHLVDRRGHVGGNAYDETDAHGVLVHRYGPHVFHTNADRIVEFLSRFTAWRPYEHRVLARVRGQLLPVPINRTTINRLYGLSLDEAGVTAFLARVRLARARIETSEDLVLSTVGPDLCDLFFRPYTRKQWGCDLAELPAAVLARVGTRTDDDDRYFSDRHQQMPAAGYTAMFRRMLDHPRITYQIGVDFADVRRALRPRWLVYTGRIDDYFDRCEGVLAYRSVTFHHEHITDVRRFQPVGTVNHPDHPVITRVTEFKHLTGQEHSGTSIVREVPCAEGEPLYPVPRPENEAIHQRYEARAAACENVTFVGRLAQYRYYNMDQAIAAGIAAAGRVVERLRSEAEPRPRGGAP